MTFPKVEENYEFDCANFFFRRFCKKPEDFNCLVAEITNCLINEEFFDQSSNYFLGKIK